MAKVPFSKLNLKLEKKTTTINVNGNDIEVLQYLPHAQKSELIQYVVNNSLDLGSNSFSPIRVKTYAALGIIKYYTDITFTEKQLSDPEKLYDLVKTNDVLDEIYGGIDDTELAIIFELIYDTIDDINKYMNSFAGMISNISEDAVSFDNQLTDILEKIKNKEGIETLAAIKDING